MLLCTKNTKRSSSWLPSSLVLGSPEPAELWALTLCLPHLLISYISQKSLRHPREGSKTCFSQVLPDGRNSVTVPLSQAVIPTLSNPQEVSDPDHVFSSLLPVGLQVHQLSSFRQKLCSCAVGFEFITDVTWCSPASEYIRVKKRTRYCPVERVSSHFSWSGPLLRYFPSTVLPAAAGLYTDKRVK